MSTVDEVTSFVDIRAAAADRFAQYIAQEMDKAMVPWLRKIYHQEKLKLKLGGVPEDEARTIAQKLLP